MSSEDGGPENGSLENTGVVGVKGMSSEISDLEVVELAGVLITEDEGERVGVAGRDAREHATNWLPCKYHCTTKVAALE